MEERSVAHIYVDKAAFYFDKAFDYLIPAALEHSLQKGCRVLVPFGNGNRKLQGMVAKVTQIGTVSEKIKPVLAQLDPQPVFTEEMFRIADFLVKNTFCTFYDAVKTILPNAANVVVRQSYRLVQQVDAEQEASFCEEERNLIQFLKTAKTQKQLDDFLTCEANTVKKQYVQHLLDEHIIECTDFLKPKVSDKTVKMLRLSDGFASLPAGLRLTVKQQEVVDFLQNVTVASKKEVVYFCAAGESVVRNLVQKGILEYYEREVFRTPHVRQQDFSLDHVVLSEQQQDVFLKISTLLDAGKAQVGLLHGITGSGKTSVFLKLIEQVVSNGKQAVMLVPEIALTPQMVDSFKGYFGEQVAVMHSSLSLGERLDEYKRMKTGKATIVVGTRSAVFAPFSKIGIVIMDEEAESSYKSESSPRYHAREVAKVRCLYHNAVLLLASATPSIESYYKAKQGIYHLFALTQRYASAALPEVYMVDMRDEEKNANTSSVSMVLQQEIRTNITNGQQTILFINRRGFHTIAACLECGEVVKCPHCDVAMTYHKDNEYMMCHYCGHAVRFERTCPGCGSAHLKLSGMGTQKIEDELEGMFPQARILRMDADTTYSRYAYGEKFEAFRNGAYDILVGTQMIAKGLDFPNVTLVGVLNIDAGLYSNDYRGVERVFSLVTQVVGRSGRAEKLGRAYLQTYLPDNPVLQFAAQQDYGRFYEDEMYSRKVLLYPPFCDICVINFGSVSREAAETASGRFCAILKDCAEVFEHPLAMKVIGPVEASVYRVNGKYRQKIIIKCKFQKYFKAYLRKCLLYIKKEKSFRNISVYVDINGDINA